MEPETDYKKLIKIIEMLQTENNQIEIRAAEHASTRTNDGNDGRQGRN